MFTNENIQYDHQPDFEREKAFLPISLRPAAVAAAEINANECTAKTADDMVMDLFRHEVAAIRARAEARQVQTRYIDSSPAT